MCWWRPRPPAGPRPRQWPTRSRPTRSIANVLNASSLQILPTQSSNTAQFGSQPVGTAGAATTFTIKNSNAGVLTHASGILTIQLAGGLTSNYTLNTSVSPATCGTYMATGSTGLASGATCLVTVAFNPAVTATLGALTDTLTVTAANDGATASLKLNGTAIGGIGLRGQQHSPDGPSRCSQTLATTRHRLRHSAHCDVAECLRCDSASGDSALGRGCCWCSTHGPAHHQADRIRLQDHLGRLRRRAARRRQWWVSVL
jgi:hypothetical protein